jgi:hypothetical protein
VSIRPERSIHQSEALTNAKQAKAFYTGIAGVEATAVVAAAD